MSHIELLFTSELAAKAYGELLSGSQHASAMDLRAAIDQPITILTGEQALIPTGIKLNMMTFTDFDIDALILPRSGRGTKEGLVLGNTLGLIDQDYQGELMVAVWARPTSGYVNVANGRLAGSAPIHIQPWERFAQLKFTPVIRPQIMIVPEFSSNTERGEGGFGSTGK